MGTAIVFRKSDLLTKGQLLKVQAFEWWELAVRGGEPSHSMKTPELTYIHLESQERFSLNGYLKRKYYHGYWWHIAMAKKAISAWPLKISIFAILLVLSNLNAVFFIILMLSSASWVIFRIYSRKGRTRFCIGKFSSYIKKGAALCIIIMIFILEDLMLELGKLRALLDRGRNIENIDIR